MSAQSYANKDTSSAIFPMLTPIEHAIMRQTPTDYYRFFRYGDLGENEKFMTLINERLLTTGDSEFTNAIRDDDAETALARFLHNIGYHDGSFALTGAWLPIHVYITINLCFASKATDCLKAIIKHPWIRGILKEMLLTNQCYYVAFSQRNMFGCVDPTHPTFTAAFIDDPLIMETIRSIPDAEQHLFNTLVLSCIGGRHYEGIDVLRRLNSTLTDSALSHVIEFPRGKPYQRFVKLCLEGYHYTQFKNRVDRRQITTEPVTVPDELKQLIELLQDEPETVLFVKNAVKLDLLSESLSLLLNARRSDSISKAIRKLTGQSEPYKYMGAQLSSFTETERSTLLTATQNDSVNGLLSLFVCSADMTKTRIEQAFLFALINDAERCARSMEMHLDMHPIVESLKLNGGIIDTAQAARPFYGSLDGLSDDYLEPYECTRFTFLLPACAYSTMISQLYKLDCTIKDIPDANYNDFRYTIALGAIIHLNLDLYHWAIDELYDNEEEEFLSDMYIRTQLLRDSYVTSEHPLIRMIEAFLLYRKCLESVVESDP